MSYPSLTVVQRPRSDRRRKQAADFLYDTVGQKKLPASTLPEEEPWLRSSAFSGRKTSHSLPVHLTTMSPHSWKVALCNKLGSGLPPIPEGSQGLAVTILASTQFSSPRQGKIQNSHPEFQTLSDGCLAR